MEQPWQVHLHVPVNSLLCRVAGRRTCNDFVESLATEMTVHHLRGSEDLLPGSFRDICEIIEVSRLPIPKRTQASCKTSECAHVNHLAAQVPTHYRLFGLRRACSLAPCKPSANDLRRVCQSISSIPPKEFVAPLASEADLDTTGSELAHVVHGEHRRTDYWLVLKVH